MRVGRPLFAEGILLPLVLTVLKEMVLHGVMVIVNGIQGPVYVKPILLVVEVPLPPPVMPVEQTKDHVVETAPG